MTYIFILLLSNLGVQSQWGYFMPFQLSSLFCPSSRYCVRVCGVCDLMLKRHKSLTSCVGLTYTASVAGSTNISVAIALDFIQTV